MRLTEEQVRARLRRLAMDDGQPAATRAKCGEAPAFFIRRLVPPAAILHLVGVRWVEDHYEEVGE